MATVKQYRDCLLNTCIRLYRNEINSSLINKGTEENNKEKEENKSQKTVSLLTCLADKDFVNHARKQLTTNKLFDPVIDKEMWQARKDLGAELHECYRGEFTS